MKKVIFLALSLCILASCTKHEPENMDSQPANYLTGKSNTNGTIDITPLKLFGENHNTALDLIAAGNNFPNDDLSQRYDIVAQFGRSLYGRAFQAPPIDEVNHSLYPIKSLSQIAVEWHADGLISAQAKAAFDLLQDHILSNLGPNQGNAFNNALLTFENQMNASNRLSESEKTKLIGTSIIARYSHMYWKEAVLDPNHAWHDAIMNEDPDLIVLPSDVEQAMATNGGGGSGQGVAGAAMWPSPRLIYDICKFCEWAADCDQVINSEQCYQATWFNASLESGNKFP